MESRALLVLSLTISLTVGLIACSRPSTDRTYTLQGQVLSVAPDRHEATIKHEDIKGLMPAMTMPYKVRDPKLLESVTPGDLINAKLVVETNDAYLADLKKVGQAPLEKPPAEAPPASSGFELLKPGESVPDAKFIDQDGRKRSFTSFVGSPLVITFIYTKCPLPQFCPLMDRNFARIQEQLRQDRTLQSVHLISISFDPTTDTPPVLRKHARELMADPKRWTFLTGDRDDIDRFGARFGVSVSRALNDPRDISHNLRTAIIDADGRLVKVYMGNEWTPDMVVASLKPLVAVS